MQERFMVVAIELAAGNVRDNRGGPFAAVIVKDDAIIAQGTNLVTSTNDPTAHAEIMAIRAACRKLVTFQLDGCDIYTTCEPCPMCLGAIYWARLASVYFAANREDAARIGFDDSFIYQQLQLPFAERKIPMIPLLRQQALDAFREWERKPDKVPY
jgi:tRNA(Arg) A34 adenosine deaminase TadA